MSSLSIALSVVLLLLGAGFELARALRARVWRRDPTRRPIVRRHGQLHDGFHPRRRAELRAIAQARANALLKQWLSPTQRAQYEREQHFDVTGSASGIRYRIHHGAQFNVEELDADGYGVAALCFTPEGALAVGDVMLAQKIALETDEVAALAVANWIGPTDEMIRTVRPQRSVARSAE